MRNSMDLGWRLEAKSINMSEDEVRVSKPKVKNYCFASNLKRSLCEAILQPLTEVALSNSTNPSNPLNKVLLLCRAAVLQLNYLTATQQNDSTAALIDSMNPNNPSNLPSHWPLDTLYPPLATHNFFSRSEASCSRWCFSSADRTLNTFFAFSDSILRSIFRYRS